MPSLLDTIYEPAPTPPPPALGGVGQITVQAPPPALSAQATSGLQSTSGEAPPQAEKQQSETLGTRLAAGGVQGSEGSVGGAVSGTAIYPGIGTAVGAVIGGISGFLKGVFSDKTSKTNIKPANRNTQAFLSYMNRNLHK